MRAILPVLLILTPALPAAEELPAVSRKKLSAISMLPDGSQLHGVMFPRYDENHRLIGVLKANAMTLVNVNTIAGETVSIEFFNPDRSPRGRADLTKAVFRQDKGLLEAREPVTIQTDRVSAKGTGLIYAFEQGEGYLMGPATTWIQTPNETSMNSHPSPVRAAALLGMSLLTLPLTAVPPPAVSSEELAAIKSDAASTAATAGKSAAAVRADLATDTRDADAAAKAARNFLVQADLPPATPDVPAEAKPLDVKPGPDDTVVSCDGGMYFDADEGVFVYLKNVRVTDPRFGLSGANELKIFLGKKPDQTPAKPGKETKDGKPGLGLGAKFGDVERIVASGAVRIVQKETEAGKEPVQASGAIFIYHAKTGEIILSGGYPWVKQGTTFMRAKEPNLNLRILKTGSFVTEGNWEMGGTIEKNR